MGMLHIFYGGNLIKAQPNIYMGGFKAIIAVDTDTFCIWDLKAWANDCGVETPTNYLYGACGEDKLVEAEMQDRCSLDIASMLEKGDVYLLSEGELGRPKEHLVVHTNTSTALMYCDIPIEDLDDAITEVIDVAIDVDEAEMIQNVDCHGALGGNKDVGHEDVCE
ncbi:hypothetical protein Tsubulata_014753 [Turnera subulata]|uniref:Uncharacterized protein n=1 Tax=Turnera subulata TaxID=218843 RepID=A0A9Q0F1I3_9ROSI|nr:hypothetical protein Tsubulata_014753 [Turnera subulata]